ncbi:MAG: DNA/RNA non-specific endonuclease [Bacteroidia bacterium]
MQKFLLLLTTVGILSFSGCKRENITPNPTPTRDAALTLGNPSNAVANATNMTNYLMEKATYALSYNNERGGPNWVAWHLSSAWKGSTARQDDFRKDPALPSNFYAVGHSDYTNTGFDRGHQCPSDDRDSTVEDNSSTFLMTNMLPQAPNANRITWVNLEDYCRALMQQGKELYIYCGGYGAGGNGSNGNLTTFAGGKVTVPKRLWKIIVVLPIGAEDAKRVAEDTRVIAVDMPNVQSVNSKSWQEYRVSVRDLETATGYNFLSNVPQKIQEVIEKKIDSE